MAHSQFLLTDSDESFRMLNRDLQELAPEWKNLGVQLNIPLSTLDAIQGEKCRATNCFREVIREWFDNVQPPHTKSQIVSTLMENNLGENRLAREIKNDQGDKRVPSNYRHM